MGPLRAFYATAYLALGAILPIMALALEDRGFSPSDYAMLLALQPALRIFMPPLWGALADRVTGTARLLRINCWAAALALGVLASGAGRGWTIAAFVLWSVVATSLFPLADAGAHALLRERSASFGYVRVFGSLGFMVAAVIVGAGGVGEHFVVPFCMACGAYALAGIVASGFPAHAPFTQPGLGQAVREHLRQTQVWLLFLGIGVYYVGHGMYDAFFGPHVVRATGMSPDTISLLWALGVLVEVPIVALAPRWLKLRSGGQLMIVAAGIATLRWGLLSMVSEPWHVWVLQPLHGVTFGLWYLAYVHENQRMAPPALRATVQGLGSASLGLGMVFGTLMGGVLLERAQSRSLFALASVAALVAGVLYALRLRLGGAAPIELTEGAE